MAKPIHSWNVAINRAFSLRIERYFVGLLAGIIFVITTLSFGRIFDGLLLTALFVGVYALLYTIVLEARKLEKRYVLSPEQLQIDHTSRRTHRTEKIVLQKVIKHKFDHFLLGGYLLTKEGVKHILFFNNKEDAHHVERALGVDIAGKGKKTVTKVVKIVSKKASAKVKSTKKAKKKI